MAVGDSGVRESEKEKKHPSINKNKAVGTMDNDHDDINKAMFLSWSKKRKYKDEITRLKNELAECRKNLDKVH